VSAPASAGRPAPARLALFAALALAVGVASLALPVTLAYDPWTWMVWGREVTGLELDTTGGPAWKPLPVLVTTPLALAGYLAPSAWLVVARLGSALALLGAYRVGARLAGRIAGFLATGLLVLTPDGGPRFVRLVAEGHTAPWTAALALWAVDRHLAGRPTQAVVLLTVLAWDRPEAWPFLLGAGGWLAWQRPDRRWLVLGLLATVPLLWFAADWWGSGSPLHGADAAQVYSDEAGRLGIALEHVFKAVIAPAWVLALVGAVRSIRDRTRTEAVLVGLALAWMALVVGMSALLGYAALTRFLLPASALLCVVAATTAVELVRAARTPTRRWLVAAGLALVLTPFVLQRVAAIGPLWSDMAERRRVDDDLAEVLDDAGGAGALRACGELAIESANVPRAALAWRAEVPVGEVRRAAGAAQGVVVVRAGGPVERELRAAGAEAMATNDTWTVYRTGC
jgi:hypothetical protein